MTLKDSWSGRLDLELEWTRSGRRQIQKYGSGLLKEVSRTLLLRMSGSKGRDVCYYFGCYGGVHFRGNSSWNWEVSFRF
jgi:hypothetical protein